jgi:hypothetical protein
VKDYLPSILSDTVLIAITNSKEENTVNDKFFVEENNTVT